MMGGNIAMVALCIAAVHGGHVGRGKRLPYVARYDGGKTGQGRGWVALVIDGRALYTTAEAAAKLGVAHVTVRDAIRRGVLEKVAVNERLNMVPEDALEQYRRTHRGRRGRPKGSRNRPLAQGSAASAGDSSEDIP